MSAYGRVGVWLVGTRSRAIRRSASDGNVRCSASDGGCVPARPASHVHRACEDESGEDNRKGCGTRKRVTANATRLETRPRRATPDRAGARPYQPHADTPIRSPLTRRLLKQYSLRFYVNAVATTSLLSQKSFSGRTSRESEAEYGRFGEGDSTLRVFVGRLWPQV